MGFKLDLRFLSEKRSRNKKTLGNTMAEVDPVIELHKYREGRLVETVPK